MSMLRPPCWPDGSPCPNSCAKQLHERVIGNVTPLHGPWSGWRMAGRELVAPDGQRLTVERLRGLLWRDSMELRRAGFSCRKKTAQPGPLVRVVVVDLGEYRIGGLAAG